MMDDIIIPSSFNLTRFIDVMDAHSLDVASAAIPRWFHPTLRPNPKCVARRVSYVDMLLAVFNRPAWRCWQSQIDLRKNVMGWGYDITLSARCGVAVGVLDQHAAYHPGRRSGDRLYEDGMRASREMGAWLHANGANSTERTLACYSE